MTLLFTKRGVHYASLTSTHFIVVSRLRKKVSCHDFVLFLTGVCIRYLSTNDNHDCTSLSSNDVHDYIYLSNTVMFLLPDKIVHSLHVLAITAYIKLRKQSGWTSHIHMRSIVKKITSFS